jgi:hypothetical protein
MSKESNNLEASEVFGVSNDDYTAYLRPTLENRSMKELSDFILSLKPKETRPHDISKKQLQRLKKAIKEGRLNRLYQKTLDRLKALWKEKHPELQFRERALRGEL